ncbi:hypothetical protein FC756_19875 [Lysinibacillus mangiferihumi]|uniref:YopX protein domain-containing protein n=1 Tax=Lysinibacillus mangiferihumi TaxID=1130819 RepID=A0A4U2YGM0_9BACI|nr:hypothetical protein [Lysinibacillus mangiferihumi]TKI60079.1 hypothetical protein FC756_19875 [Lysinibacillus mangiferihumi]
MGTIKFRPIRNIYWDNNGRAVLVFHEGKSYEGEFHESGKITATTPYYDADDYINESDIEIISYCTI